jgi:peptidoglycan/xylan/chitin deacetylase (PgdA/CDA1 family)
MRIWVLLILVSFFVTACETPVSKDIKGNDTKTEKETNRKEAIIENRIDTGITIYLTFDDGPYTTTPAIDSVLTALDIKASFFIVGSQMQWSTKYDSIYLAEKNNPLFKIYNHTYSHAITNGKLHSYYAHPDSVWLDIEHNKAFLGLTSNITRLPGTNSWKIGDYRRGTKEDAYQVIKLTDSLMLTQSFIGWDAEWRIGASKQIKYVDTLIKKVGNLTIKTRQHQNHVVILFHDFLFHSSTSLEHLVYFIQALQNKYHPKFEWVENYPGMSQSLTAANEAGN